MKVFWCFLIGERVDMFHLACFVYEHKDGSVAVEAFHASCVIGAIDYVSSFLSIDISAPNALMNVDELCIGQAQFFQLFSGRLFGCTVL